MKRLGMEEGEAIEHRMVTRAIARSQAKVEARNFDVRKHLLEYDDVMNRQRESIYGWRREILSAESLREQFAQMALDLADELVADMVPERGEADTAGLQRGLEQQFGIRLASDDPVLHGRSGQLDREAVRARAAELVEARLDEQVRRFVELQASVPDLRAPTFDEIARAILLQRLDALWKDHLLAMDHLKEGVGLRGYGGQDPKREYQKEGYQLFLEMNARVRAQAVEQLFRVVVEAPSEERLRQIRAAEETRRRALERRLQEQHASVVGAGAPAGAAAAAPRTAEPVQREVPKVGRNEACPCGSGRKYKKCHGAAA
jgi:preprotein translocase subunit SecA